MAALVIALGRRSVALRAGVHDHLPGRSPRTSSSTATAKRSTSWKRGATSTICCCMTANRVNQPQIFAALLQRRAAGRATDRARARLSDHRSGRVWPLRDEPAHSRRAARRRPAPVRRLHRAAPRAAGRAARPSSSSPSRARAGASSASGCCSAPSTTPPTAASSGRRDRRRPSRRAPTTAPSGRPTGAVSCRSSSSIDFNAFYGRTRRGGRQADGVAVRLCLHAARRRRRAAGKLELARRTSTAAGVAERHAADAESRAWSAPAPQAWPVELRAGANQLLVKVCKTTGEWSFTARITDTRGTICPASTFAPALPEPPVTAQPEAPTQLIDGFGGAGAAPAGSRRCTATIAATARRGGRRSRIRTAPWCGRPTRCRRARRPCSHSP